MQADQSTMLPPFADEVVSPEPALVDAELGARARVALTGPVVAPPAPAVVVRREPAATLPSPPSLRVPTPVLALLATAAASLVVTAFPGFDQASAETPHAAAPAEDADTTAARAIAAESATRLVWDGAAGVAAYDVELRRRGAVFYSSTTTAPEALVPPSLERDGTVFVLQPEDQLYVWPVVDGRRESPVVDGALAMDATAIARTIALSQSRQP